MPSRTPRSTSSMVPSAAEANLMKKRAVLPRALTYPLSLPEYRASPFSINAEGDAELQNSKTFQTIRNALAKSQDSSFCDSHVPSTTFSTARWLLHRDITHSLIRPLIHIHKRASLLASRVLCIWDSSDLELAFRGEARGVFSWLQCFITEEEDWSYTRGCPACVVLHVMQSEPALRLVLASARLARAFSGGCREWIEAEGLLESDCGCDSENQKQTRLGCNAEVEKNVKSDSEGRHAPFNTSIGMPAFQFWRQSLREAINADPFWGPEIADEIEERAARFERGFMGLIAQCCALEEIVAIIDEEDEETASEGAWSSDEEQYKYELSPMKDGVPSPQSSYPSSQSRDSASRRQSKGSPRLCFTPYHGHEGEVGIIRRGSVLAEKGMKGLGATVAGRRSWLNRALVGSWTTLLKSTHAREEGNESDCPAPGVEAKKSVGVP